MTVNNYTIGMAEELLVIGETRKKVGSKDRITYVAIATIAEASVWAAAAAGVRPLRQKFVREKKS
jgi:hypothetical protein